ncbi:MAG: 50S ribosomal protein L2 [Myxococcaceae bacterium]|nr:50S ribosomal protein L2 [Myxococcaceae bacterium]MBH2006969.1 50S ribosomal protein L2 [Myxococcaceae bacterium]
MGIKYYKPTSPARRLTTGSDFSEITKKEPEKRLTKGRKAISARGATGRITVRFRGGAHKRKLRDVEFSRSKLEVPAVVKAIEYDPNRSARLALLQYADGVKSYILAPVGLSVGDQVLASATADIKPGNCLPLKNIPIGTSIHNIELRPGKGAQMVRSAGGVAQLMAREGAYANIRLPSGENRLVLIDCTATIGQVGNVEHELIRLGKAGRKRWLGRKPHNRGVTMNPVDHPHGGGEGRTSGGRHPVSPWGQPTKGHRTRNNKRTNNMIVKRRK